MTGIVFTISLLAAFQPDAALPAASGAMYLSVVQRNGAAIERIKALLPALPDQPTAKTRSHYASLQAQPLPDIVPAAVSDIRLFPASVATAAPLPSAPIRGPDSVLM